MEQPVNVRMKKSSASRPR